MISGTLTKRILIFALTGLILCIHSIVTGQENEQFYYENDNYINYKTIGRGSKNILFIHGFGSSLNTWEEIADQFEKSIYKLYMIDLKGFGSSACPKDSKYGIFDQKQIIIQFIYEVVCDNFSLVGHSLGGGICLLLATDSLVSSKIEKLILIDSEIYSLQIPYFVSYLKKPVINNLMLCLLTDKAKARFSLRGTVFPENFNKQMVKRYTENFKGHGKSYALKKSAKLVFPEDYYNVMTPNDKIDVPTMLIWGKDDKLFPVEATETLNSQINNSKLEVVDQCGHIPQEEKPVITFKIINDFLK
jgi:pimeloyl-ACP methyl ester carboxylesterase